MFYSIQFVVLFFVDSKGEKGSIKMFFVKVWLLLFALAGCAKEVHVVLFVIDDVGMSDLSIYNRSNDIQTPVFNNLLSESILLNKHYSNPVCSPSRASLMQGRHSWKTGLQQYNTIMPASTAALNSKLTLAEVLKEQDYETFAIGKWHLGYSSWKNTPTQRGFSSHKGYLQGEIDYYNKSFAIPSQFLPFPHIQGLDWWENETVIRSESSVYNKDLYDKELIRVLDQRNASKPLFLYFAHQLVSLFFCS